MKTKSSTPILLTLLLLLGYFGTMAQKTSFDNIFTIELRNSGPLVKENVITGYYMFYKVDKVDKNTNAYLLRILDQNLNEVAKKEMNDSKTLFLQEASSDGQGILLKFYDTQKKQVILRKFNSDLKMENIPPIQL